MCERLSFVLLLIFLAGSAHLVSGCVPQKQAEPPRLYEDREFLADLGCSTSRGPKGITVVAPASGFPKEELEGPTEIAKKLGVNFPKDGLEPGIVPYNAGRDEARLSALVRAMADDDAEVIWAVRGGYGSSRLLGELEKAGLPKKQKVFIGYSDMTFLHLFLQKHGWRTIHGAMFFELGSRSKDVNNFRLLAAILAGRLLELTYSGLKPFNQAAFEASGPVRGKITGGNLTCLAAAAGTPWPLEAAGKILFLEDVQEPGYKIDRMLTQLKMSGQLDGVRAIILGEFTAGDQYTEFALERFAKDCGVPVFKTDLFGHGNRNYPLVFNSPAAISREYGANGLFQLSIRLGDE